MRAYQHLVWFLHCVDKNVDSCSCFQREFQVFLKDSKLDISGFVGLKAKGCLFVKSFGIRHYVTGEKHIAKMIGGQT